MAHLLSIGLQKRPKSAKWLLILSRGTSRDGTGQSQKIPARPVPWQDFELVPLSLCPGTMKELLSRCPFVPGQKSFACPAVPKSCTVPSRWKP